MTDQMEYIHHRQNEQLYGLMMMRRQREKDVTGMSPVDPKPVSKDEWHDH